YVICSKLRLQHPFKSTFNIVYFGSILPNVRGCDRRGRRFRRRGCVAVAVINVAYEFIIHALDGIVGRNQAFLYTVDILRDLTEAEDSSERRIDIEVVESAAVDDIEHRADLQGVFLTGVAKILRIDLFGRFNKRRLIMA